MPKASKTNPPDTFMTGAAAPACGVLEGVLVDAAVVVLVARVEVADELLALEVSEVAEVALVVAPLEVVVADVVATDLEVETAEVADLETVFVESMLNCGVKFEFPEFVSSMISSA